MPSAPICCSTLGSLLDLLPHLFHYLLELHLRLLPVVHRVYDGSMSQTISDSSNSECGNTDFGSIMVTKLED